MRELKRWPNGIIVEVLLPASETARPPLEALESKQPDPLLYSAMVLLDDAGSESPKKERLALTACFLRRAGYL